MILSAKLTAFWALVGLICLLATAADAVEIRSSSGATARVSAAMAPKAQCLIRGLESRGYRIKFMGGYGKRKFSRSKHPAGNAIDINQLRRNVVTVAFPVGVNGLAHDCGLISGGEWRHRADIGHFELPGKGHYRAPDVGIQTAGIDRHRPS